jgi:hypothetical protein
MYYVSSIWWWQLVMILIKTNHSFLRVGCQITAHLSASTSPAPYRPHITARLPLLRSGHGCHPMMRRQPCTGPPPPVLSCRHSEPDPPHLSLSLSRSLSWVPWAVGYGPTNLDTTRFPPVTNGRGTKYAVPDMDPPLLVEREGRPT